METALNGPQMITSQGSFQFLLRVGLEGKEVASEWGLPTPDFPRALASELQRRDWLTGQEVCQGVIRGALCVGLDSGFTYLASPSSRMGACGHACACTHTSP